MKLIECTRIIMDERMIFHIIFLRASLKDYPDRRLISRSLISGGKYIKNEPN